MKMMHGHSIHKRTSIGSTRIFSDHPHHKVKFALPHTPIGFRELGPPALEINDVHVWIADLNVSVSTLRKLKKSLSAEERSRGGRYRFQKDRDHFIAARGQLRELLSLYLNAEPQHIFFRYNLYGKPELSGKTNTASLRFSVSHSRGTALYALTLNREIGVDLESICTDLDSEEILEISRRFFSPREFTELYMLPADELHKAFYACWTRKEAYIKAKGKGLSLDLKEFDVSLSPDEPPALLSTVEGPGEVSRWTIEALDLVPGYVGALAVEGNDLRIKCMQYI